MSPMHDQIENGVAGTHSASVCLLSATDLIKPHACSQERFRATWRRAPRQRWQSWLMMFGMVVIALIATTANHAAVIVRGRQSTIAASAYTGIGSPPSPTADDDFEGKFTDPNAPPDFSPFNQSASATASVMFDDRPRGGQSFFSGSALSTASQNSRLRFNATGNELFGAIFSAQGTASASGAGNVLGTDSRALGTASFNLIFDVTGSPAAYTLRGSAMGDPVRDDGELRAVRVGVPSPINVFDLANGSGSFDFSGQLAVGTYQLRADMAGRAGGLSGPPGSARFNLDLEFEDIVREMRWVGPNGGAAPADGSFQVAGNWSGPIVPGAADVAVFDLPGTYTVDLDRDVTNKRLRANGTGVNVSLDLNGNDYVLDTISVGGLEGDSVSLAFNDSSGPASVAAAGASDGFFQAAGHGEPVEARLRARLLEAGKGGTANVNRPITTDFGLISNGGKVTVNGEGHWDVPDLTIGREGIDTLSTLTVSDGGHVISQRAVLSDAAGIAAISFVNDQGSFWDTRSLVVGNRGGAVIFISKNAVVTGRDIVLGSAAGSVGTITLEESGSLLQNPNDKLTVGLGGNGSMDIGSGSKVVAGSVVMGAGSTGSGNVKVTGGGRLEVSGVLSIGSAGNAVLTVDGGHAERTGAGKVTEIHSRGTLAIRAGQFHEREELIVNGAMAINPTNGAASIGTLPIGIPGQLSVRTGGTLKGTGTIIGKVAVFGGDNNFDGRVRPANSTGTLTIDGDYEQTGGQLGIEIGGTAAGQFDVLAVTGDAAIGGELLLEFIDGFAPRQGDTFNFLDIDGALSGAFEEIEVRNLMPGFQFDLRRDGGGLTMVALNDGVFIPEPATLAMLCAGMTTILFCRYTRRYVWRSWRILSSVRTLLA